jgi:hypothetical protein
MAGGAAWVANDFEAALARRAAQLREERRCTSQEAIELVRQEVKDGRFEQPMSAPETEHPTVPESGNASDASLTRYLIAIARMAGCREADVLTSQELLDVAEASPQRSVPYRAWLEAREATK